MCLVGVSCSLLHRRPLVTVTGSQASDANNLPARAGPGHVPGQGRLWSRDQSAQARERVTSRECELRTECVRARQPGPDSCHSCDTDWPASAAAAVWARLPWPRLPGPDSAGRWCAGPGCCELRAGLRILTSTLARSARQSSQAVMVCGLRNGSLNKFSSINKIKNCNKWDIFTS